MVGLEFNPDDDCEEIRKFVTSERNRRLDSLSD